MRLSSIGRSSTGYEGAVMEKVTFTVRWDGAERCQLVYVIDNGELKASNVETEPGRISVSYDVQQATTHVLEWSLLFPGRTRTGLSAAYERGGKISPLDKLDSATNRWASRGAA
jgi:hypothetical protein